MSSKTKIIVLHMKEIIYTVIFLILAVILGIVIYFMFGPKSQTPASKPLPHKYKAGIYNSSILLNNNTFDVEVTVDADRIKAIHLINLSESTQAMFPLMEPALESLASQIYTTQSLENLEYPSEQKYTSLMLIDSIRDALKKAEIT